MTFPIRCITCNKVVADKILNYQKQIKENVHPIDIFNSLHIDKYCCRRMFLCYSNTIFMPKFDKMKK